jgi:hypothetical protein
LLRLAVVALAVEGVLVVANRGDCPLGGYGNGSGIRWPLFELVPPPRAAKSPSRRSEQSPPPASPCSESGSRRRPCDARRHIGRVSPGAVAGSMAIHAPSPISATATGTTNRVPAGETFSANKMSDTAIIQVRLIGPSTSITTISGPEHPTHRIPFRSPAARADAPSSALCRRQRLRHTRFSGVSS